MAKYVDVDKLPVKQISIGGPMLGRFIGVVYADDIAAAPAADVAPVRHGRWVQRPNGEAVCNRCGVLAAVGNGDALKDAQENQHFCFNCGARMDKEDT